jgi:acyl-CoA reductase-like NAD-dependent aldehyde dehydrogenase
MSLCNLYLHYTYTDFSLTIYIYTHDRQHRAAQVADRLSQVLVWVGARGARRH